METTNSSLSLSESRKNKELLFQGRKLFSFKGLEAGSKVEIVEVSKSKTSKIVLNLGAVAWVKDCLSSLAHLEAAGSIFRRRSSPGYLCWIKKFLIPGGLVVWLRLKLPEA